MDIMKLSDYDIAKLFILGFEVCLIFFFIALRILSFQKP